MRAFLPVSIVAVAFLAVYHGPADAAVQSLTALCQNIIVQATAEAYAEQYATAPTVAAIDGAVLVYLTSVLKIPNHLATPLVPRIQRRAIAIYCGIDERYLRKRRAVTKPKSCTKSKAASGPKEKKKNLDDFAECKACKECNKANTPKPGK